MSEFGYVALYDVALIFDGQHVHSAGERGHVYRCGIEGAYAYILIKYGGTVHRGNPRVSLRVAAGSDVEGIRYGVGIGVDGLGTIAAKDCERDFGRLAGSIDGSHRDSILTVAYGCDVQCTPVNGKDEGTVVSCGNGPVCQGLSVSVIEVRTQVYGHRLRGDHVHAQVPGYCRNFRSDVGYHCVAYPAGDLLGSVRYGKYGVVCSRLVSNGGLESFYEKRQCAGFSPVDVYCLSVTADFPSKLVPVSIAAGECYGYGLVCPYGYRGLVKRLQDRRGVGGRSD